jgi:sugar/nucleoside kinase (ribokinase family)
MLPGLGFLVLGREEAVSLVGTGDPDLACAALLAHGVNVVGLKLGNEGCQVAWDGQQALLPGWKVSTVDTTGAGDAFCAGMIYGLLLGLSLPACGLLANTLGALATTVWGGGPALPGKAEVRQFLRQRIQSGMPVEFDRWAGQVLSALDTDLPQGEGF